MRLDYILLLSRILLLQTFYRVSGQYHVRGQHQPQYLYHRFPNITEKIFPLDIRINISLSRITGTLLYSIDRNLNQLIVSFQESVEPMISIEFRRMISSVSICDLCQCTLCLYEILDLRIQVMSRIQIQCNWHKIKYIEYGERIDINTGYPNPYSKIMNNSEVFNEAHLWLVNHPQYDNIYPNHNQLSGCIFSVQYNNADVKFPTISDNIVRNCTPACKDNICNGGQCLETYDTSPVCNCTSTLRNGPYCNDTMSPMNLQSKEQDFKFDLVKVSWRSSNNEILKLSNKFIHIHLRRYERNVSLVYIYSKELFVMIKATISTTYIPNTESILIAHFKDSMLDIQFYNNGSWVLCTVPMNINIRRTIFESLAISSGTGVIDIAFKIDERHIKWSKLFIVHPTKVVEDSLKPMMFMLNNERDIFEVNPNQCTKWLTILISIICGVIVGLLISTVAIILKLILRVKEK